MESQVEQYAYDALPTPSSIRLVKRCGRDSTGKLNLTMKTVDLEEKPSYYCLSYTTGNPYPDGNMFREFFNGVAPEYAEDALHPVVCNGKEIMICKNLLEALEQLPARIWVEDRKTDSEPDPPSERQQEGFVWIDAICINKDDLQERNN